MLQQITREVRWHVIMLQEVGRELEQNHTQLTREGHTIHVGATKRGALAVGFAFHKDIAPLVKNVQHYDRVSEATIRATQGPNSASMDIQVISTHLPSVMKGAEELPRLDVPLQTLEKIRGGKRKMVIVGGDFNVELTGRNASIGPALAKARPTRTTTRGSTGTETTTTTTTLHNEATLTDEEDDATTAAGIDDDYNGEDDGTEEDRGDDDMQTEAEDDNDIRPDAVRGVRLDAEVRAGSSATPRDDRGSLNPRPARASSRRTPTTTAPTHQRRRRRGGGARRGTRRDRWCTTLCAA